MYPKFKLVKNLAKLIFCLRNTQIFLQKMSALSQNQIQKDDVEWLTRMSNNQQDGAKYEGSFSIFSYFAIPFSQSNTLLNSTKLKAMTRIGSEAEQISWRHMTSSAFLWSFNSFPVSREKALLKWPNFKKLFERHICKVQNC